ncbi:MAG: hypothetical protein IPH91_10685 [Elusimicrobia bacterium]|nr:hypothetical protein [Elusimicrobiota bacterium]
MKILKIRYACNEAGVIKSLYANGVFVRHVTFPPTGSWSAYGETQTTVTLEAGLNNTLKLENGAGDAGGVNIDSYAISDYTPGDYEAEQGRWAGRRDPGGVRGADASNGGLEPDQHRRRLGGRNEDPGGSLRHQRSRRRQKPLCERRLCVASTSP